MNWNGRPFAAMGTMALAVAGAALAMGRGVPAHAAAAQTEAAHGRATQGPGDPLSYAMGVAMARSFKTGEVSVDADVFTRGLRDGLAGGTLLMSEAELRTTMAAFDGQVRQKQVAVARALAKANRKAGEAFLAANAKKDGVVTLPSGLQYAAVKVGLGGAPADADTVTCHVRTARIDGTEVGGSRERGKPVTFQVAGALPAWREALKLMPAGSTWRLVAPAQLAYGDRGLRGPRGWDYAVEPGATLVFELELLSIEPASRAGARLSAAPAQTGVR
ncbi:MAG TPA: FKBP-type peptidyl-prolyl cis-trans isomerase [Anaeromyxobacteraceae bacterium]|nr:FKBP-type peptidyl-prolyl cis-trans isomerase [Anaeromyxobacteraceae bacterium]